MSPNDPGRLELVDTAALESCLEAVADGDGNPAHGHVLFTKGTSKIAGRDTVRLEVSDGRVSFCCETPGVFDVAGCFAASIRIPDIKRILAGRRRTDRFSVTVDTATGTGSYSSEFSMYCFSVTTQHPDYVSDKAGKRYDALSAVYVRREDLAKAVRALEGLSGQPVRIGINSALKPVTIESAGLFYSMRVTIKSTSIGGE